MANRLKIILLARVFFLVPFVFERQRGSFGFITAKESYELLKEFFDGPLDESSSSTSQEINDIREVISVLWSVKQREVLREYLNPVWCPAYRVAFRNGVDDFFEGYSQLLYTLTPSEQQDLLLEIFSYDKLRCSPAPSLCQLQQFKPIPFMPQEIRAVSDGDSKAGI